MRRHLERDQERRREEPAAAPAAGEDGWEGPEDVCIPIGGPLCVRLTGPRGSAALCGTLFLLSAPDDACVADEPEGYAIAHPDWAWIHEGGRISIHRCRKHARSTIRSSPTKWTLELHIYPGRGQRGFYEVRISSDNSQLPSTERGRARTRA